MFSHRPENTEKQKSPHRPGSNVRLLNMLNMRGTRLLGKECGMLGKA